MMETKIKVLIVDDSATFANLLKGVINRTSDMISVGIARDGYEAIEMTKAFAPDVITMDILMPKMDGLEATKNIMSVRPTPIVVISSHLNNKEVKSTFNLLDAGAVTIINKPSDILNSQNAYLRDYLIETIRMVSAVNIRNNIQAKKIILSHSPHKQIHSPYRLLALGASTGGPAAYKYILGSLPESFPVPIVAVQHIAHGFIDGFVDWLGRSTKLTVKLAEKHEKLKSGIVYFAPDNFHLHLMMNDGHLLFTFSNTPPVNGFKPSISELFQSLANLCPKETIAGLLTGIGDDGVKGLQVLHTNGGKTFAQDKESSIIFSMPGHAQSIGAANDVLNLTDIPHYLTRLVS